MKREDMLKELEEKNLISTVVGLSSWVKSYNPTDSNIVNCERDIYMKDYGLILAEYEIFDEYSCYKVYDINIEYVYNMLKL